MSKFTRHSRTRRVVAAVLAAIAAAALSGCGGSSKASGGGGSAGALTVGFVVDPSWAQIPVAESQGYFKSEGVNVKVINFSTGVQALQALAAGQLDVTTAADVPVAASLTHATNMKIVADGSRWKGSVVIGSAKAGIRSPSALAGKSVGTPLGTSAAYFASSFLKQSGITAHLVNVDPSAMVTAMQQGNVNAISIFQPYQQQVISALGKDAVVLTPAPGTYVQQSLYLASQNAVQNKAAALKAFEAALNRASGDLKNETSGAVSAVATATQLSPALVKTILPQFDYTMEMPSDLPSQLDSLGKWAITAGNLSRGTKLPDYGAFIDGVLLPKP